VQPLGSNGLKTPSSDAIAWGHENSNRCSEEIFEVFATIPYSSLKVIPSDKLKKTIFLIVVVTMQHELVATCGDAGAKIFNKFRIFVKWMC
jgi:hypothetical protein